jgi:hypothetical protein
MKKILLLFTFSFLLLNSYSQEEIPEDKIIFPKMNVGFGGGIDYGGFGCRLTIVGSERLELFGAFGYNMLGLGINAGIDYRLMPRSRICPFIGVMYGYNAVIKVTGADQYNRIYYGPSLPLGIEFWSRRSPNFLNLEVILPFRSSQFKLDYKHLQNLPNFISEYELLPIGISIGYHFTF